MSDWVTARYLHAEPLAQWFKDRGLFEDTVDASLTRAIRRWETQQWVDIYSADHWLVKTSHTLSELPDELFV